MLTRIKMGCGLNNEANIESSIVYPKPFDPLSAVSTSTFDNKNFPIIWLKVSDPLCCSKCKHSFNFITPGRNNTYLCSHCYPHTSITECPKGHLLSWVKEIKEMLCNNCGEHDYIFYICQKCDYRICTTHCKPIEEKNSKMCPNGHILMWKKNAIKYNCVVCDKRGGPGYICVKDNFFICSTKCRKINNTNLCPNGHKTEWHKITHSQQRQSGAQRYDQVC